MWEAMTLTGAGHVILSDSAENVISGTSADVTLTNVDNTIDGSGDLGSGRGESESGISDAA